MAIEVGTSIPAARVVRVLDQLVALYGRPQALRLDNGPELTARVFVDWCDRHDAWLVTCNEHRPHDALGRVPPLTYLARVTTRSESNYAWST